LGEVPLEKLTPMHLQSYYSRMLQSGKANGEGGLSPQTVLHHHRLLRQALSHAVRWNLRANNPADLVDPPRVSKRKVEALDEEQMVALLNAAAGTPYATPVMLAVTTGMRRGEIFGLKWDDVDLDEKKIRVRRSLSQTSAGLAFKKPKNSSSERTIELAQLTVDALRAHRTKQNEQRLKLGGAHDDSGLVVCRDDGKPWPPDSFSSAYSQWVRRAGFDVSFHELRHTHASQLLKQGHPIRTVSDRLGHSEVSTTLDVYAHMLDGMQREAADGIDAALQAAAERLSAG
jgi:integrase